MFVMNDCFATVREEHTILLYRRHRTMVAYGKIYLAVISTDFPTVHMVKTHFLLENLWISEHSLGVLEKFQRSSALPKIKYNCVESFMSQLYWLFIYASKYIFP